MLFNAPSCDLLDRVQTEESQVSATVVVAEEILPAGLCAAVDLQRADSSLVVAPIAQAADKELHRSSFADCQQQITQNIAVKCMQDIVVFETEDIRGLLQLVHEESTYHAERICFRIKGKRVFPSVQVNGGIIRSPIQNFTAPFLCTQKAKFFVFFELLSHCGLIQGEVPVEMREIVVVDPVNNLLGR